MYEFVTTIIAFAMMITKKSSEITSLSYHILHIILPKEITLSKSFIKYTRDSSYNVEIRRKIGKLIKRENWRRSAGDRISVFNP